MGLNMSRFKEAAEEHSKNKGEFLGFEVGETLVYVHPPCRDKDKWAPTEGLNYVPHVVHYGVGKGKKMIISLDPASNPIIEHPYVKKILDKRRVKLTGKCPMAKALADEDTFSNEEADQCRPQMRFLWGMTPMGFRKKATGNWTDHEHQGRPMIAIIGKTIFEGLCETIVEHEGAVSDPKEAILVRIIREGTGRMNTKYKVKVDQESARNPIKLPKKVRAALAKALAVDGDCDLFRVIANMIKGPSEVKAIIKGIEVSSDKENDMRDEDDDDIDDDEEEDEDERDEDDDDSDDDSEDDDEDDDSDDEDEDDDSEDDDDEDDEDEDDDDDEDVKPKKKGKKASKKTAKSKSAKGKSKKSKKSDDDDDDDEDEEDDESRLGLDDADDDDDEDEDMPKTKKAKAKTKKTKVKETKVEKKPAAKGKAKKAKASKEEPKAKAKKGGAKKKAKKGKKK